MPHRLMYVQSPLERAGIARRDEAWVRDRLAGDVRVLPVAGQRSLIDMADPPEAVLLNGMVARAVLERARDRCILGLDGDTTYVAAAVDRADAAEVAELAGTGDFIDLRAAGRFMDRAQASLLAHARGLVYWHARHRFCGVCGHPAESHGTGHARRCTNPDCGVEHFPRTDPAVIMLVIRDDLPGGAALLGRQRKWPEGMYSTLAGFVEPGESLEQAVAREVFEESGVRVERVTYMASQPWPFPASLMLGFHARAVSTDISFAPEELEDARWFPRDEVAGFPEWDDAVAGEPRLPRRDSIARWLVERWLAGAGAAD